MNKLLRSFLAVVAISVPVLAIGGEALAKGKGGKGGKAAAAVVDAKFSKWMLTPNGKIGGILLDNGGIVRVHHAAVKDTSLKAGDALHVDGKSHGNNVMVHAKITKGTAVVVDDTAKPAKGANKGAMSTQGLSDLTAASKVSQLFIGHHGKVAGLILDDGTVAYAPHKADLSTYSLKKGDAVTVTGKGGTYTLGRALVIKTIKLPNGDTKTL
jgi:hypothetical protein